MVDPVDELVYLRMECELAGYQWAGDFLLRSYQQQLSDSAPAELSVFYHCYRAFLRAKLSAAHLLDEQVANPARWQRKTVRYLKLAAQYAQQLSAGLDPSN